MGTTQTIRQLEHDESASLFDSFDSDDAWALGAELRARASADRLPVMIDIRRPSGMVLFRAALAGASPNHEDWIRRKAATVIRFESSSALVAARMDRDEVDPLSVPWLSALEYAIAGGGFPIRVPGVGVVAVVCVSGMSAEQDHALIVEAIRAIQSRDRNQKSEPVRADAPG